MSSYKDPPWPASVPLTMSHQVRYQRSNPHISPVSLILYPHAHSDFTCTSRSNNLQVPTEQLQLTPLKSNFPGHIQRGARKTIKPQKVPSLPQFFLYFQEKNRKILIQARWFFQSSQNTITASPPGMGKGHNKLTGSTESYRSADVKGWCPVLSAVMNYC